MKKTIMITILTIVLVALTTLSANASGATLANDLYSKLSAYGLTSADKVKIERYLADNPATDAQASTILSKADEAIAIMNEKGTTDVKSLSKEDKNKLKSIAQDAANTIGLTLSFKSNSVEVYKDGKLIETISNSNGKLAYTGNTNTILIVSSIAVIALAVTLVAKNRFNKVGA